jgi:ferritin-like metal-binding protein YciE
MQISKFMDMYIAELQELASAAKLFTDALQRMASVASHPQLKEALSKHREETRAQAERLESILRAHGAPSRAHTDQAMQALINETKKMLDILKGKDLRDSGLIASAQKLEHYEMAAYGTAASLAGQLDLRNEQRVLRESLEEEKKADALLSRLATTAINQAARTA